MKDNVLQRYLQPKTEPKQEDGEATEGGLDDLGSFGFLRGIHDRALMLELRYKNGNIDAFPYAWLNRASFDPSEGITLRFGSETVTISGQHLNAEARAQVRLFDGIVRHRVPWVREADGPALLEAPRTATVIEVLKVK
jgi:hypothetical protein